MAKKISLITICFNSEKSLQRTIDSVRLQSYPNLEYIIVDGASKDATLRIIRLNDDVVSRFISEPDKGIYDAINKGLRMATGDVIGLLHADDTFADSDVLEQVNSVFENNEVDALYGDLVYVKRNKGQEKIVRDWKAGIYIEGSFRTGWMPPHPTFYIKRNFLEKIGGYNADFKLAGDYEFMLRAIHVHQAKLFYLKKYMVKMTVGGASNSSLSNRLKANKEDMKAWKVNNLEPKRITFFLKPLRKIGQFIKI